MSPQFCAFVGLDKGMKGSEYINGKWICELIKVWARMNSVYIHVWMRMNLWICKCLWMYICMNLNVCMTALMKMTLRLYKCMNGSEFTIIWMCGWQSVCDSIMVWLWMNLWMYKLCTSLNLIMYKCKYKSELKCI